MTTAPLTELGSVERPIVLGQDTDQTLAAVAMLRDGLTQGTLLEWHGELASTTSLDLVCHLPPPQGSAELHARWRARFRPGLCYFRRGPGFLQVKDSRAGDVSVNLVIDDPLLVDVLIRCLSPTRITSLTTAERAAVDTLADEQLLLSLGDQVVTLPHRMRRWPVPALDV